MKKYNDRNAILVDGIDAYWADVDFSYARKTGRDLVVKRSKKEKRYNSRLEEEREEYASAFAEYVDSWN